MNKVNFVKNGISKLPPGFRFQPTDEELVFQYLKCKVFSYPLPATIIPEINVCNYDPWDLPGNCEERYFFSSKDTKYRNGNRMNRTTNSGYWKASGTDKRIISTSSCDDSIVGIRKTLVFYEGKSPNGSRTRTDWVLHEYRLVTIQNNYVNELGEWVLCRLLMKKRNVIESDDGSTNHMHKRNTVRGFPRLFDFMMVSKGAHSSSSSSSSSSNNIEVSSNALDHDEETSGYGDF